MFIICIQVTISPTHICNLNLHSVHCACMLTFNQTTHQLPSLSRAVYDKRLKCLRTECTVNVQWLQNIRSNVLNSKSYLQGVRIVIRKVCLGLRMALQNKMCAMFVKNEMSYVCKFTCTINSST